MANPRRGSGGYEPGRPVAVIVHHTASGAGSDGQPDVDYIVNCADEPLANLYLARSGAVWIEAAAATNTNGTGGPLGPIPTDQANTHVLGIEAGNNGTGEPWPDAQQRAYTTLVTALCDAYLIPSTACYSHAEWAPGRKIDPAGPSRWAGAGTWPMDKFRADVAAGWPGPDVPPPLPPTEELPVTYILESTANDSTRGQLVLCDAGTVRVIGGGEKNALGALKVPKYGIPSATEWAMLTAAAGK